jgi:hypothetical protein
VRGPRAGRADPITPDVSNPCRYRHMMQIPSDPSARNGRTLVVVSVGGRAGGGTSCKADAGIRMVRNFFFFLYQSDT